VERGRASSPLPPALVNMSGDDESKDNERQLTNMQEQQTMTLAEVKSALTAMPPPDPKRLSTNAERVEREQKRRELIKLLAEIERRINMENARPKKRYVSPATREAVYAVYYDHLRRAIEDKGTQNFPQQGGQKLYGELTMIVTVNFDGHVLDTEVVQSSGIPVLDRRAQAIARSAGPYGKFNAEMRRQADQIAVVSRFKFTRDDTLETKLSTN
jgi:protein TonB